MKVTVYPSRASGTVTAPPSKSYGHRMMLCAALSNGVSTVRGISSSDDMAATLGCIASLGVPYEKSGDTVVFHGNERKKCDFPVLDCRESGSTLRFLIPLSLFLSSGASFTGTKRLFERGIGEYEKIFSEKGIKITKRGDGLRFDGRLTPGKYTINGGISSQFVTGLLLALPLLDGDSALCVVPPIESRPYIDITLDVLRRFGISVIEAVRGNFYIPGHQSFRISDMTVEGDHSSAAFLHALSSVGGDVNVLGLNDDSAQGDRVCKELLKKLEKPHAEIDVSDCPDLAPVLFAVAAAKHGAHFTGTRRLKIKESDRAAVMAKELEKFGVRMDVGDDCADVYGGTLRAPTDVLDGHNDHRVVMALSVLSTVTGGTVCGCEAVAKSYPTFFDDLAALGVRMEVCDA